jgi:hypothetical protein
VAVVTVATPRDKRDERRGDDVPGVFVARDGEFLDFGGRWRSIVGGKSV